MVTVNVPVCVPLLGTMTGPTAPVAVVNEQVGPNSTAGETALHDSVTAPEYPFREVTVMTAVAPLPATTLLGVTGVVTVSV